MKRSPGPSFIAHCALCVAMSWAPAACVPPQRMCSAESDCGAQASCLGGRCVAHGATPAIDQSRRLLFAPVDVAYLRRGADTITDGFATLGSTREAGALVLLRFSAPLPSEATVLEAYLLLERATAIDADPVPVSVHAARVAEPWDGRAVTWGRQPHVEEIGSPVTRVSPSGGTLVRLDVRELVRRWRRRRDGEFGLAVVANAASPSGIAVVLTPTPGLRRDLTGWQAAPAPSAEPVSEPVNVFGPRLELYVK